MYSGNDSEAEYVECDLVNSYAWDTAIVYIQAMGNDDYANETCETNGNYEILKNTGTTGDEKCHIFDMAGNLGEWSTEYSGYEGDTYVEPYVTRGDIFSWGVFVTAERRHWEHGNGSVSFRLSPTFIFKVALGSINLTV